MARADDHSPLAHRDAAADLSGVDITLECEAPPAAAIRASSIQNDGARQLGAATFTQQPAEPRRLAADLRTIEPDLKCPPAKSGRGAFYCGRDECSRNLSSGMS
jgi:hypothetical protein